MQAHKQLLPKLSMTALAVLSVLSISAAAQETPDAEELASKEQEKGQIEQILVTAQRRVKNLQETPVAVTAVSAENMALAKVDNISNISLLSPSIKFDVTNSAANSANIIIRGIGTVGNSRAFEGAVGVFVDGVYRTRAGQAMQYWLDMDSLQILRGPQGTLFGKNTSAGAVLVESTQPVLGETLFNYELTAGNYGLMLGRATANFAIGDNTAVRIAGLAAEQDGFIEDPNGGNYNEKAPRAAKVQIYSEPTSSFNWQLIADYSKEEVNCCYGQVDDIDGPLQPVINSLILARGLELPSENFDDYEQVLSNDTAQTVTDKGAVLKLNWQLSDSLSLHSVTGYRDWKIEQIGMDADFTGANILGISEALQTSMFSQEITLNGELENTGMFESVDYILGAYYADEDIDAHHELWWGDQAQAFWDIVLGVPGAGDATPGKWSDLDMPATSESMAAFMHWNLGLSEKLELNVGLRYSKDEKTGAMVRNYFTPAPNTIFRIIGAQPGPEFDVSFSDSAVSGSIALKYQISPKQMTYASYSRGYKSGGINIDNTGAGTNLNNPDETPGAVPLSPAYKSEFIDGYEIGLKSDYLDGKARTNLAVFYNKMDDLQIAQFIGTRFTVDNAPEASVYGLELENQFVLNDYFTLDADVTWLAEAKFGNGTALDQSSTVNLSDRDFAQAPEWAGNIAISVDYPVFDNSYFVGRLTSSYAGSTFTNTSNDFRRDGQTEWHINLGIQDSDRRWGVFIWCQNCTDERYPTQHFNSPLQGADANTYVSAPRTFGVTLRGQL